VKTFQRVCITEFFITPEPDRKTICFFDSGFSIGINRIARPAFRHFSHGGLKTPLTVYFPAFIHHLLHSSLLDSPFQVPGSVGFIRIYQEGGLRCTKQP